MDYQIYPLYNQDNTKGDLGYDVAVALVKRTDNGKQKLNFQFNPMRSFTKDDLIKYHGENIQENIIEQKKITLIGYPYEITLKNGDLQPVNNALY